MSPITGITPVDSLIWNIAILTGQVKFPLFDNLFKVPLADLTSGYTFGPDYPGYFDSAGPVFDGLGFRGTTVGPNGENLMPWANTTFTLDLFKPFRNFFTSLMADPFTNPIQLPDLVQFGRALQTLAAGLVIAFDPITPGSPFCPGRCSWLPPALDYPGIVRSIGNLWPGNPAIDEWLNAYDTGRANGPTQEQIDLAVKLKNIPYWDFGNPSPPPEWSRGFNLSTLAPAFHALWTALGFNPPPLATPAPATDPAPSIAALAQKPVQNDVKLDSIPQRSEGQTAGVDAPTGGPGKELRAFEKPSQRRLPTGWQGLDTAQPEIQKDSQSTTTSTNATDDAEKPKGTDDGKKDDGKKDDGTKIDGTKVDGEKDDGKKFQPRQVTGDDTPKRGLADAPKVTRDQSQSPSSASPSQSSKGGS
jgi:hypothetical protein